MKKCYAQRWDCTKTGVRKAKPADMWFVDDPESKHRGISVLITLRGKVIELCLNEKDIKLLLKQGNK